MLRNQRKLEGLGRCLGGGDICDMDEGWGFGISERLVLRVASEPRTV